MTTRSIRFLALFLGSAVYWQSVSLGAGAAEPWDAGSYWRLWYPVSLLLAALAGFALRTRWGLAGAIVTIAQLPVMAANAGGGRLLLFAATILCVLAAPAIVVAALAARVRTASARIDDGKRGDGSL